MKRLGTIITKTSTIIIVLLVLILAGCASQTGKTTTSKQFDENFRFVPRVHVDENSFGVTSGAEFWGCSYDQLHEGYWCPVR